MSVIIVFPDGTDWFKANSAFRQLAQDVSNRYSSDAELCKAVEEAEALGALDLKKMNDGLRSGCAACCRVFGPRTVVDEKSQFYLLTRGQRV